MTVCPQCHAKLPPGAVLCGACEAEPSADEHGDVPTLRTRPKLLVLRSAARATVPADSRLTDHGEDEPADPPAAPPEPSFRLRVVRGLRVSIEYPLYEGPNLVGRGDERQVEVDLRDQEPPDRIWASRQHATLNLDGEVLTVEDLNSTNGTYVNRHRLMPGAKRRLKSGDVLQIGTVQFKVTHQATK